MNIKFIAIVLLLILIFIGYPKFMMKKREDEARAFLKGPFTEAVQKEVQPQAEINGFKLEILNQYPNFLFYQTYFIDASKLPKLASGIDLTLRKMMCNQLKGLSFVDVNEKAHKAFLNVLEKDKVTFHLIVKDKFGVEVMKTKQQLSECEKINSQSNDSINYQISPTQIETVAPATTAAPVEAAASAN